MELSDYVRMLRKRWWIVAVAVIVTAGSAFVFTQLQYPEYSSTAELIVNPARPDFGLTQSAKIFLRPYMTVADSYSWAQRVIDELQLPMTPEGLRANTNFAAEDDRMVIKIQVKDYDGDQANDIARTWANLLVQWRDSENTELRKEDRVEAILRDQPRYAQSWPPRAPIMLGAGVVFGLVVAGVIVLFLEWLEGGVIRTPQDVERELDLTVVGAIPSSR